MENIEIPQEAIHEANVLFSKYDLNGNESIEISELKSLMTDLASEIGIPVPSDEDVEQVMSDTDINRDKKLCREEFLTLFKIIYIMKTISSKSK